MVDVLQPTPENVRAAAECIREGGVVVAPSDTNVALTLDPHQPSAIDRAYEIKGRPEHKPLTLFVPDPGDWRRFGRHDDPELVEALADAFWPGPLNLVLEYDGGLVDDRLTREGTVAIGCLSNPVWRDLAAAVGGPVAMTSANESGTVPDDELVDVETAVEHVGDGVDCILASEPAGTTRASTILDLTPGDPGTGTVRRRGDVTPSALRELVDVGEI